MYMAEGMDTGDMILKLETPIGPEETGGELFDRLAPLGAECLSRTLRLFEEARVPREVQDESQATYAGMLDRETGTVDLTRPALQLHNLIRGVSPWPGASLRVGGKLLKIRRARLAEGDGPRPGVLLREDALVLACGEGAIELLEVQPEGKRPMSGADFLRGRRIKVGTNFMESS